MNFFEPSVYLPKLLPILQNLTIVLQTLLPSARIEHIGSSAIREAISKGDLDIFVGVSNQDFVEALLKIKSLGFFEKVGTLRTESLCMLITDKYPVDVAIQLVEMGSEFEDFIRFRNILNLHPELVEEYNALKLNSVYLSHEDYREKKSIFIQKVLE